MPTYTAIRGPGPVRAPNVRALPRRRRAGPSSPCPTPPPTREFDLASKAQAGARPENADPISPRKRGLELTLPDLVLTRARRSAAVNH